MPFSMNNYKKVQLYEKKMPKNKTDTVIKLYRNDKKKITRDEVEDILEELKKKNKNNNVQIIVRGRNIHDMTTLKGLENDNLIDHDDEYYNGYDADKFEEYFYLEITLRK